ncbi:MAG: hypothetical protein AUH20_02860 [Candidatus Rokubacteria bacterium 13_2_20CM_69_15_2]|nr:MAG: hypothetical protein AUH20_02860 [Candidatus Rokubacteria bacterium 13_2_20CM_69_15_2]
MRALVVFTLVLPTLVLPAPALADCAAIELALAGVASDVRCVASPDLTTRNADTTPPDNSRPGLPPNAFTPRTDAQAVSADAPFRTTIDPDRTFPGLQITGAMIDDANARWVLRLPTNWNGRLVVGVPGGFRSEFMGDFIFSDLVIQLGYAYVSTNKGMLNFFFSAPAADPAACRLSPQVAATGTLFTHFYVDDPADTIREWFLRTLQATDVAEMSLEAHYDRQPERVYLFGISNGGHVVRRMLSEFPTRFDGGVDWEGVYWSAGGPNILIDLPVALRNWEPYVASGFSRQSAAFQAMLNAGYPPDIFARPPTPGNTFSPVFGSHWETHANNYWDVTTCVFVRELDPLYPMSQLDPLGRSDTKDYDYAARRKPFHLAPRIGQIATDGDISRPLVTLQGTMDALLPIKRHGRPFRDAVVGAGRAALHRYYEIQNGNHIERYRQSCCNFTQLEFIQPHAHRAFQLLVDWVERGVLPPPSQCVPRGGTIVANPGAAGQPERCAALLEE